jgi:undecaprenyl-diphosphatase
MPLLHLVVLAIVQGITEFLPISSSGHLVLVPALFGWQDQGQTMDVAVHLGTLAAVLLYFWRDVWSLVMGLFMLARGRPDQRTRLVGMLLIATLPAALFGLWLHANAPDWDRSVLIIGWTTLGFGLLIWIADGAFMHVREIRHLDMRDALIIGLMQAIALIPGTSRSGITMTGARFLGFTRVDAARFSFLLSIPTIAGAGLLAVHDLMKSGDSVLVGSAITAGLMTFFVAVLTISLLMHYVSRIGLAPFALYRILLGGGLLVAVYTGALG